MDTQNNAKGGYGYGGDADNPAAPVSYMTNSQLSVAWTAQHSCGSENAECQTVIQYMCNSGNTAPGGIRAANAGVGEGPIRDGTDGDTPNPNNPNANRGLHEPTSFYQDCENTERNQGLYVADQNLNANDATRTRQNPNGARSGLECPEERDYYPYWRPSPWKDLAILTNNVAMCEWYQANSQNVAPRGYCTGGANGDNLNPITEASCTANGGTWNIVPAFGIAPPECMPHPVTRDNHLGNDQSGNEVMANISIPAAAGVGGVNDAQNCVLRLRYNITTADTRVCEDKSLTTEAACVAAGKVWSSFYLDSSFDESTLNSNPPLPEGNPDVNMGGFLTGSGGTDSLLELAVNTNQFGRTFQDRTHVFEIQSRPPALAETVKVYNLNVKGKRGNIVQTYPATEYDFHPVTLELGSADMVHVQWTGNDNTNNNGEGTDNEDRHNIVQVANTGLSVPISADQASMFDVQAEWNPEPAGQFGGVRTADSLKKQFALVKQTGCAATGDINNDQQDDNCQKLNAAAATVDLGLLQMKPGSYSYSSSRDNNFSNRAVKAKIGVLNTPVQLPHPPINVEATPIPNPETENAVAMVTVSWAAPQKETPYIGTDGKPYWGMEKEKVVPVEYLVERSCDGGANWVDAGPQCKGAIFTCTVTDMPAGTTCAFRVKSASPGGWSEASHLAIARTLDSEESAACKEQLIGASLGVTGLSDSTIMAASGGGVALLLCICLGVFLARKKKPPPPPPEFKEVTPPPY
jgi:hypothetical protein